MNLQKVLLTGGSGFIGYHLSKKLLANYFQVFSVSRQEVNRIVDKNFQEQACDISVNKPLKEIQFEPDFVIHLAAYIPENESLEEYRRAYRTNVEGFIHVLNWAVERGVKKVINFSSMLVYDEIQIMPVTETGKLKFTTIYGITKVLSEYMNSKICAKAGIDFVNLRVARVYGLFQKYNPVIDLFIQKALNGQHIEVFGSGKGVRDYIYIEDITEAILKILCSPKAKGIFNLGGGEKVDFRSMAEIITEVFGSGKTDILFVDKDEDESILYMDISKLTQTIAFTPQYDFKRGVYDLKNQMNAGYEND